MQQQDTAALGTPVSIGGFEIAGEELRRVERRFWAKVSSTRFANACWKWTGAPCQGYGRFCVRGKALGAHRIAYELTRGPIPEGLVIDHLCRNRMCCNPAHLEVVTGTVNILRGVSFSAENAAKTHCPQGHPLWGDNVRITRPPELGRVCKACDRERKAARKRARRESVNA